MLRDRLTRRIVALRPAYGVYRRLTGRRRNQNRYVGCFDSFDQARAAVPPRHKVGYDNAELASWYRERLDRVFPDDYPLLFWLERLLPELTSIFDFGGHVGLHFHGWRKLMAWPERLIWTVCEVPAVVDAGKRLAGERGTPQLKFTTRPDDVAGADLFLASGSLQYLEPGFLPRLLEGASGRPKHLLLNKLPVHPERDYVTLQDAHLTFHPYTVISRARLISSLEAVGYQLVDEWQSHELDCQVMLRPDLDVTAYTGAHFAQR